MKAPRERPGEAPARARAQPGSADTALARNAAGGVRADPARAVPAGATAVVAADAPGSPTREEILAAAVAEFSARGYAATTMRRIAARTGVSLGTIYYHFDGKEAILHALLCDNFRRVHASLQRRLRGVTDPRRALAVFVDNHVRFFARHLAAMRVMSHELDTLDGVAGREVAALRGAYTQAAFDLLARIRPDLPAEEIRVHGLCLFGMLNWTYRWYHTVDAAMGPGGVAERMTCLFLSGFEAAVAPPSVDSDRPAHEHRDAP